MRNNNILLYIDGGWREGSDHRTIENRNPVNDELIGTVAVATRSDLELAAAAAVSGFADWRERSALDRSDVLRRAASLVRERLQMIAEAMTREQGKPLAESLLEATLAAQIIDWFAEEGRRAYGRIVPSRAGHVQQNVIQVPVGPVASFAPWNFPLTQLARKIAVALAAGCSIIIKPPEEAPVCTAKLFECFVDAGVPAGVINLVYGVPAEISAFLVSHPAIRKISFTGSVPVGKQLAALAGLYMKRSTMELGGHAPAIVTRHADVEAAARILATSKYANAGQACISPTRILLDEPIAGRFTDRFLEHVAAIKVGDGLDPGTTMGPLNNERRLGAMQALIADAVEKGADILAGGHRIGNAGLFFEPTVVSEMTLEMDLMNQEPFGPIAILHPFADLDDAIGEANRLPFGLAAYAFTDSAAEIARITAGVETGMLGINHTAIAFAETPFGGVKDSGYGSDGGLEALQAYLQPQLVTIATRP